MDGLVCRATFCAAPLGMEGDDCDMDDDCEAGLACIDMMCSMPRAGLFESC